MQAVAVAELIEQGAEQVEPLQQAEVPELRQPTQTDLLELQTEAVAVAVAAIRMFNLEARAALGL
jgi:hypothetical protein